MSDPKDLTAEPLAEVLLQNAVGKMSMTCVLRETYSPIIKAGEKLAEAVAVYVNCSACTEDDELDAMYQTMADEVAAYQQAVKEVRE